MMKASTVAISQPSTEKPGNGMEHRTSQAHQTRAAMSQGCFSQAAVLVRMVSAMNSASVMAMAISASTQACRRPSGTRAATERAIMRRLMGSRLCVARVKRVAVWSGMGVADHKRR
jgi:hypothetical protein